MTNTTKLILGAILCLLIGGLAEQLGLRFIAGFFTILLIGIFMWLIFGPKPKRNNESKDIEELQKKMINFRKKFASENEFKQFKKVYDQIKPDQMQNIHILSKGHLMCPKCKIKYSFKELIENSNATIYRTGSVKDNQDINGLICFKCVNFSEWKKLPEEECIWEENGGIKYLATTISTK